MKIKTLETKKMIWFVLQVLAFFAITQFISYGIGHFSPTIVAIVLLVTALLLFIAVFTKAYSRDRRHKKPIAL